MFVQHQFLVSIHGDTKRTLITCMCPYFEVWGISLTRITILFRFLSLMCTVLIFTAEKLCFIE